MPNNIAEVQFLLSSTDAYNAHRAAWQVMGSDGSGQRGFHYDFRPLPSGGQSLITLRADKTVLPDQASEVNTYYAVGQPLAFSVAAVASKTLAKSRKILPLTTGDELWAWLLRNGHANGFAPHADSLGFFTEAVLIRKPRTPAFFLNRATFDGVLSVTDSTLFANTLRTGIGKHRGLGFGMMKIQHPTQA
ncbi:hypothetical protein JCM14076_32630 [Methylosoma difficile]